ncbi:EamA family transporter [Glycomyces sp. L485]|uniref:DMT family transporter n=1 Tax=Glycomyces sp. L485 TaxID=2909235 RepID=UPI001F4A70BE|nr:EamA family transporter [Glycomyces sp. L485]MCH7232558.1 EamA family transporter [Glycomyces sp. L485]
MSTSIEVPARPRASESAARRGLVFLTVTALTWGTTGTAADLVYRVSDLGPIAVSFWRHLGGLALLLAVTAFLPDGARRRPARPLRNRSVLLVGIGISMAVFQTAYFASVDVTGVAVATIVTLGSCPIVTAVGGRLFLGERIGRGGALAIAGALTGLAILVGGNAEGVVEPLGVALGLLSAAGYAGFALLGRLTGRDGNGEDPFTLTMWSFGIGAAVLLPLAWFEGLVPHGDGMWRVVALMGYLAVFTTALAYPFYFAGAARVRAATASVMMLIEPVTAAMLAVFLLGEAMTAATLAGTLILLGSIACLAAAESRPA